MKETGQAAKKKAARAAKARDAATKKTTRAEPVATPPRVRGAVPRAGGGVVRRVTTYLEPATYEKLKTRCGEERSLSDVVGEAVRLHLESDDGPGRAGATGGASRVPAKPRGRS